MRNQGFMAFAVAALVAVVGVMLVSCAPPSAGVKVRVKNATGGEISNVQVRFTGGSEISPKLKVAETFETRVNPKDATDLVVVFVDSAGKQHSSKVDVYIEPNFRGSVDVTLQPGGKVSSKSETKVSYF